MNNQFLIEAVSMDLLRAALGIHSGSLRMADKFKQVSRDRLGEIDTQLVKPYLQNVIKHTLEALHKDNSKQTAEDLLTYSILFQDYALTYKNNPA